MDREREAESIQPANTKYKNFPILPLLEGTHTKHTTDMPCRYSAFKQLLVSHIRCNIGGYYFTRVYSTLQRVQCALVNCRFCENVPLFHHYVPFLFMCCMLVSCYAWWLFFSLVYFFIFSFPSSSLS